MLFHQMNIWLYEVSTARSPRISDFYWEHIPKSDHQNNEEQNHKLWMIVVLVEQTLVKAFNNTCDEPFCSKETSVSMLISLFPFHTIVSLDGRLQQAKCTTWNLDRTMFTCSLNLVTVFTFIETEWEGDKGKIVLHVSLGSVQHSRSSRMVGFISLCSNIHLPVCVFSNPRIWACPVLLPSTPSPRSR